MQLDPPFQLCNRSAMRDMKKFSFVSFWLLQSVLPTRPDFSRLFRKLDDGVRIHSDCSRSMARSGYVILVSLVFVDFLDFFPRNDEGGVRLDRLLTSLSLCALITQAYASVR